MVNLYSALYVSNWVRFNLLYNGSNWCVAINTNTLTCVSDHASGMYDLGPYDLDINDVVMHSVGVHCVGAHCMGVPGVSVRGHEFSIAVKK
jgi:hypothetical protein